MSRLGWCWLTQVSNGLRPHICLNNLQHTGHAPTKKDCESVSGTVMPDSLRPHGLQPARLHRPWNSPGKNTGMGCHSLLQGIVPTQGLNCISSVFCIGRQILCHWCHLGSPYGLLMSCLIRGNSSAFLPVHCVLTPRIQL